MGRILAPFGVKGWIKIRPYTAATQNLLAYPIWWVGRDGDWQERVVGAARVQGRTVVARLEGCDSREMAAALRGGSVAVPRAQLLPPPPNVYYWADLIGMKVVNGAGQDYGLVTSILQTGANDVLVVYGERERLIPFIQDVVRDVDLGRSVVRVEWDADY
jgi:16S rRNA processing protein RimM